MGEEPADRAERLRAGRRDGAARAADPGRPVRARRTPTTSVRRSRAGRIDFDDLLTGTIDLLSTNAEAAATIRARKRWFSVDEFQDTSPLQERLLALWAAESRDVCVVGDADQTIYTFAGASPALPRDVRRRPSRLARRRADRELPLHAGDPGAREPAPLERGRPKRLSATRPAGPAPTITRHATDDAELAWLVGRIRALVATARRRPRSRSWCGRTPSSSRSNPR